MPLGIEQNNHLLNLTLDVWQDQIFFDDSAFPAGYFAADILNVSDETMRELLTHGGEISFQVEALANAGCEEFIKLLPETRTSMEKVLDALWKCPPYSFLEKGKDFQALDVLFDPELVDELLKTESPIRQFFFRYLTAGFSIPLGIFHFAAAGWYFEAGYLHRLKKRTETYFAIAPTTASPVKTSGHICSSCPWRISRHSPSSQRSHPPMYLPKAPGTKKRWYSCSGSTFPRRCSFTALTC